MQNSSLYKITLFTVALLTSLAIFQLLLIFGAPIGKAAWGGSHAVLPPALRIGSAVTIIIYSIAILAITARAGWRKAPSGSKFARIGTWFFGFFFLLSGLLNFASSSPWERYFMAPIAALLGVSFILAAKNKV